MNKRFFCFIIVIVLSVLACSDRTNRVGWDFSDPQSGGFQETPNVEQETPPDMILIAGGDYLIKTEGSGLDSIHVDPFYISKYEETNEQYMAYLNYLRVFYEDSVYYAALPDTMVWDDVYIPPVKTDQLKRGYLRGEIFKSFPVVGLTPAQVEKYAIWKTDRINESILIREGVRSEHSADPFSTQQHLSNMYHPSPDSSKEQQLINLNPSVGRWRGCRRDLGTRIIRMEDGILMPYLRVPQLDEWKLAALAIGGRKDKYVQTAKEYRKGRPLRKSRFLFLKNGHKKGDHKYQLGSIFIHKAARRLEPVCLQLANNYGVQGMSSGVSELVKIDSLSYAGMGENWKQADVTYTPFPLNRKTESGRSYYVGPLQKEESDVSPSKLLGFRLAMSRMTVMRIERTTHTSK